MDKIKEAYKAGLDRAKNGANLVNCNFRHFATPDQTRAWERGTLGQKLKTN